MLEINQNFLLLGCTILGLIVGLQFLLSIGTLLSLRSSSRERNQLSKEMFGLVRKLEGLTSHRREQVLRHYDQILQELSTRLPPTIAAHTSQVIFETESKILTRLAELEPGLKDDDGARKKMDELIKSMESLEHTIVALASDTVKRVLAEGRRSILESEALNEDSRLAA